jgi:Predicted hydrolases or acyltransferases (alpha/beta hydrolase superfamily)
MKKIYLIQTFIAICFTTLALGQNPLSQGEHFADINGIKMHYYVSGKGPVCLFPTPGWGPSINYLKNSLMPLEKYFTMVYYDTRMSGQSTGPEDPTQYTSKDFMNDMDSLRVHLKQEKVWAAGHSAGGFQVLNYGIHHNDRLNGIIAFSPMVCSDSLYKEEATKMVMKRQGKPYFEKATNVLFGKDTTNYSMSELMEIILPLYFHDEEKIADFAKLGDPQLSDKAFKYTQASGFGTECILTELTKIKVPTLIVVGDDDFICDKVSQADRIHQIITDSDEIVIKNAGHFSWIEQPEQFFADTEKWLKKQKLTNQ